MKNSRKRPNKKPKSFRVRPGPSSSRGNTRKAKVLDSFSINWIEDEEIPIPLPFKKPMKVILKGIIRVLEEEGSPNEILKTAQNYISEGRFEEIDPMINRRINEISVRTRKFQDRVPRQDLEFTLTEIRNNIRKIIHDDPKYIEWKERSRIFAETVYDRIYLLTKEGLSTVDFVNRYDRVPPVPTGVNEILVKKAMRLAHKKALEDMELPSPTGAFWNFSFSPKQMRKKKSRKTYKKKKFRVKVGKKVPKYRSQINRPLPIQTTARRRTAEEYVRLLGPDKVEAIRKKYHRRRSGPDLTTSTKKFIKEEEKRLRDEKIRQIKLGAADLRRLRAEERRRKTYSTEPTPLQAQVQRFGGAITNELGHPLTSATA